MNTSINTLYALGLAVIRLNDFATRLNLSKKFLPLHSKVTFKRRPTKDIPNRIVVYLHFGSDLIAKITVEHVTRHAIPFGMGSYRLHIESFDPDVEINKAYEASTPMLLLINVMNSLGGN